MNQRRPLRYGDALYRVTKQNGARILAVLALGLAFSCWPLVIAFGHLARKQFAGPGRAARDWPPPVS
ncbi:MAG: hypothetical protein ACRDTC_13800 [Pseudonocardiaceae bacterium]